MNLIIRLEIINDMFAYSSILKRSYNNMNYCTYKCMRIFLYILSISSPWVINTCIRCIFARQNLIRNKCVARGCKVRVRNRLSFFEHVWKVCFMNCISLKFKNWTFDKGERRALSCVFQNAVGFAYIWSFYKTIPLILLCGLKDVAEICLRRKDFKILWINKSISVYWNKKKFVIKTCKFVQ